jgi:hypothetical protein
VAAVEAGRNMPAVDAGLRLAGALGTSVEDLFAEHPSGTVAALGTEISPGSAVRVGRVGDRLVAAELPDHGVAGAGWAKADGVLEAARLRLFAGASPAGLVLAGCDPAVGVAERMLDGLGSRSLLAVPAPTGVALAGLRRERVHAAVVHGVQSELPPTPVAVVRWQLAHWQVGLAYGTQPGRPTLEAVLGAGATVAQRDETAASQQAFVRALRTAGMAPPDGPRASGHLDAARIAAITGGAGVTTEAAARAFGLDFLALEDHTVEVWVAERWAEHPGVEALGEVLTGRAFAERVAHFGGYDLKGCGDRIGTAGV